MDRGRFDSLARRLGEATTRRGALRTLVGGTVALAAGTTIAAQPADATCGGAGARCNRDAACCSGTCEWSTLTRGRRRVRVGACTVPAPSCKPQGDALICVTTSSGSIQLCNDTLNYGAMGCSDDAECQTASADCGGSDTCFCMTGIGYRDAYLPSNPTYCMHIPAGNTCPA